METAEVIDRVVHDHREIHERLAEWETAAKQLNGSTFAETQHGLERLWKLVPFFEKEVAPHFQNEEANLFPRVTESHPGSAGLVTRFLAEHAEFSRQWQAYKRELLYSDAVGETSRLRELSQWLIELLRQHMQDEERELLPLVGRN